MTREEFKTTISTISGLIIDIAELNTPDDNHPSVSISVGGFSGSASVFIWYSKGEKKHYTIAASDLFDADDPQEAIRELEEIKRSLEKERAETNEIDSKKP